MDGMDPEENYPFASVAQLAAQLTCNEKVEGSIPFRGPWLFELCRFISSRKIIIYPSE